MNRISFIILTCTIILVTAVISRNGYVLLLMIPLLYRFIDKSKSDEIQLDAVRNISEKRLNKNGETDVEVLVLNKGNPIDRIKITENIPTSLELISGETVIFTSLEKGESFSMKYRVKCKRGRHLFNSLQISTWNNLGLKRKNFTIAGEDEIVAMPASIKLRELPINVRKTLVYAGLNPSGRGGDGVYFHDIREYQSGDSLRHIHWSAVARRPEKLITKEFEQEKVSDIGIILDARADSYKYYGTDHHLEYGIEAVSALSEILLSLQNRVGLLVYGNYLNWTVPGYGKMQAEKIRRSLAVVETGSHLVYKTLDYLPSNLFPEKSQLIFVSPLISKDIDFLRKLKGRGYMIIIICIDSLSKHSADTDPIALDLAKLEKEMIIRDLERSGITVLNWNLNDSIEKLIQMNRGRLRQAVRGTK